MAFSIFPTPAIDVPAPKTQKIDIIKSTQSWTAPADVSSVEVILCGGGGGGGNYTPGVSGFDYQGAGGGGSLFYEKLNVTPESSYTVTIGSGGAGNSVGGTSSFGALLTAVGGSNGSGFSPGAPAGLGGPGGFYEATGSPYNQRLTSANGSTGAFGFGGGGGSTATQGANGNGAANTGSGGKGTTASGGTGNPGGSGIAIIKYWSAL